jgi:hypothetical protein
VPLRIGLDFGFFAKLILLAEVVCPPLGEAEPLQVDAKGADGEQGHQRVQQSPAEEPEAGLLLAILQQKMFTPHDEDFFRDIPSILFSSFTVKLAFLNIVVFSQRGAHFPLGSVGSKSTKSCGHSGRRGDLGAVLLRVLLPEERGD